MKEEFVFTKAKFPQCHASTICETSRGLVVAWFGGTREKDKDVGIWTSYHDGNRWSSPKEWATGIQHDSLRYPCWNPVLFQAEDGGPTSLFFKVGPDPRSWWGEMMFSYDQGRTFRDRRRLPEGIDGPCPLQAQYCSQTIPCCVVHPPNMTAGECILKRLHLNKENQQAHGNELDRSMNPNNSMPIQPTFLEHANGRNSGTVQNKRECYQHQFFGR